MAALSQVPVHAVRGISQEVLIGLGPTAFDGVLQVTPFERFEADHLRTKAFERDRLTILQALMDGAEVVRVVPLR